jgi:hypothetical protein
VQNARAWLVRRVRLAPRPLSEAAVRIPRDRARPASRAERVGARFRADLCAFAKQLILADPQDLMPSAQLIREHRHELEYLVDLIQWRLKLREQKPNEWNEDNPFY